jgi:hypothetical protein
MTARNTYTDITTLIRNTADDRDVSGGVVFTDTFLAPFVNAAQMDMNMMLADAGSPYVKKNTTSTFVATTDLSWDNVSLPAGGTPLPSDFLFAYKLWEKLSTDPDREYTEMDETNEQLPDLDQSDRIRFWMQRASANGPVITTLGSTATRTVRCLYASAIPAFTGSSSDPVLLPGSYTVLAYDGLKRAALSRGEVELAQYADGLLKEAYDLFKRMHIKGGQRRPRRRIAFGMRTYYRF